MSLITLIVVLVIVGVTLWAINTYVPMDHKIKAILNIAVVLIVILWLLNAFGVLSGLGNVRVGGAIDAPPYIHKAVVRY